MIMKAEMLKSASGKREGRCLPGHGDCVNGFQSVPELANLESKYSQLKEEGI